MPSNIEEQLREIMFKIETENPHELYYAIKKILSLITSERKEGVEGFVDFLKRKDEGAMGVSFRTHWTINGIKSEMSEYLSQTKGGNVALKEGKETKCRVKDCC